MKNSGYESIEMLDQYLLFHYGSEQDQLPFAFGPHDALDFPVRCISECLDKTLLPFSATALDLGCAVGRSTFELSRYCEQVIGIDNSHRFIQTAKLIQSQGYVVYSIHEEGSHLEKRTARLPKNIDPSRIDFLCQDVMKIFQSPEINAHVVLAANLICRLPDPVAFLTKIHQVMIPSGQLIITTPYSWKEEFTPSTKWIQGKNGLKELKNILDKEFELRRAFNMPFLMREHLRKYQWGVSQASIWIKK